MSYASDDVYIKIFIDIINTHNICAYTLAFVK